MSARKKIGESSSSLTTAIAVVATALVIVVGVAIGLLLSKTNPDVEPHMPSAKDNTSATQSGTKTSTTTTTSGTSSAEPSSSRPSTTPSTRNGSTSASATTSTTSTTPIKPTSPTAASSTSNSPETSTRKAPTTTSSQPPSGQDFGTGRSDVDGQGFANSAARCHSGDRAFAILATDQGSKAAACESRSGRKYYRGTTADGNSLETDIIVDEGDRIVAQNGSWKYQMSPEGLLITQNNVVKNRQAATAWGTA